VNILVLLALLLVGVAAAMLVAWWARILSWKPEPAPRVDATANARPEQLPHDVMTTGEGTRLLLSRGRLTVPDRSHGAQASSGETASVGD
jgi:hypothetical protein